MEHLDSLNTDLNQLIQQMVISITELNGDRAIENALEWLRRQCCCDRAMFYQFKGPVLLTCITSNVDSIWRDLYRHARLAVDDPVIRGFREELGFLEWDLAFAMHPPTPAFKEVVDDHLLLPGVSYGYSNEASASQGVITVCSLNAMSRPLTDNDRYLLSSLVPILHMAGRGRKFHTKALTEKELEVLKWARAGKTAWEIGVIREISEATVKYHFKSIYSKLGVSNRAQAVGEALYQGILK
ncbi:MULTISPECIES: LuxR C-terminal-related transcriptional regulator [unclassified Pseudomonas]|uniref:helix-turn-helix transcriptional regulator n=1 Tax=unclassified Pseudomonas TaxID=196821 RepID=UPI002ACB057D|nr:MULTISPECIES: LuxR C-terminal-related transcriptional regulator [unclassified Pseudomonas]MEB0042301.1 LuxR C-terminal-related transcriptional regulator [Pseudomonas sp. MH10]MEB0093493.1 LuxR C-terminal-related transcriptional regulator [Pseudomonas sp. CCI4.2]MEB0122632.1 LuxR C-terminal-related transcriptional regulator [Pseudomonas sp. CCI1.2]WPX52312.1 LuxR C-terminal-related transcriptional regulator [Pseudomonas sp. CCI4.2]WPX65511.1 LuxR C-terminal-related transcriptional regulator 